MHGAVAEAKQKKIPARRCANRLQDNPAGTLVSNDDYFILINHFAYDTGPGDAAVMKGF